MSASRCPVCHGSLNEEPLEGLCARCLSQVLFDPTLDGGSGAILTDGLETRSLVALPGYTATAELARGGMGIVYRATQHEPEREVALKMLLPHQLGSVEMRQRFQLEARTIATLEHPAILPVYQVGECDGIPFFTMKLAAGGTLSERLQGFRGQWDRIAELVETLAEAVHFAHQRGVLHRDLKPGNVLFDESGQPYVSDFGLAKLLEEDVSVTATFDLIGTPRYLPPEVVTGGVGAATVAGDVYGLCTILYELMVQRPIFDGTTPAELMRQIVEVEPIRPSILVPGIPVDLETICLRGVSKSVAKRFASAADLAADLRRWRAGEPIESRPVTGFERIRMWAQRHRAEAAMGGVILFLLLALTVGSAVYAVKMAASREELRHQRDRAREELFNSRLAQAGVERLAGRIGRSRTGIALVTGLDARGTPMDEARRTGLRDELAANLSLDDFVPTGRGIPRLRPGSPLSVDSRLRFAAEVDLDGAVVVRPLDGPGKEWRWSHSARLPAAGVEFDPVGSRLLVTFNETNDVILDLADRREVGGNDQAWGGFSPRGNHFLSIENHQTFWLRELESARAVDHWDQPSRELGPIAFDSLSDDFRFASVRAESVEIRGRGHSNPILTLETSPPMRIVSLAWRGDCLAGGSERGEVILWNLRSGVSRALPGHRGDVKRLLLSPDGKLLVSSGVDGTTGLWDVASGDRLGSTQEWIPVQFSRVADELAVADADEIKVLKRVRPAGRRRIIVQEGGEPGIRSMNFSPDSSRLAVARQDGIRVFRVASAGPEAFMPLFGAHGVFWEADGRHLLGLGRNELDRFAAGSPEPNNGWTLTERSELAGSVWLENAVISEYRGQVAVRSGSDGIGRITPGAPLTVRWLPPQPNAFLMSLDPVGRLLWVSTLNPEGLKRIDFAGAALEFTASPGRVRPLVSPEARWMLQSTENQHRVVDLSTGKGLLLAKAPNSSATPPWGAWTADGALLALVTGPGRVSFYSTADWHSLMTLEAPTSSPLSWLGFNSVGRTLALGLQNDTVELWDLEVLDQRMREFGIASGVALRTGKPVSDPRSVDIPRPSLPLNRLRGHTPFRAAFDRNRIPSRADSCTALQLDLSSFFNWSLDGVFFDPATAPLLKPGLHKLAGVAFDVRAAVMVAPPNGANAASGAPPAVRGIPVRQAVAALHFLGASDRGYIAPHGDEVGAYVVHYADGKSVRVPVRSGIETGDHWWNPDFDVAPESAPVAWRGLDQVSEFARRYLCLYRYTWRNDRPTVPVDHIDFVATNSGAEPFVVAITADPVVP